MTVIAFKVYEDRVEFACDSLTIGSKKHDSSQFNHCKINKINDNFLIATSGRTSESILFKDYCSNNLPRSRFLTDIYEFMDGFRCFKNKLNYPPDKDIFSTHIIYYYNKVYLVMDNGEILEVSTFYSIGSGSEYAYAAMHLGKNVSESVKVSIDLDPQCGGNVNLFIMNKGQL